MKTFAPLGLAAVLTAILALSPAAAATTTSTAASVKPNGQRPRICLVLSGGGARGAAHVGVIKVLEEYRIPIDCIAGTSMGSLVGAAYATGMTVPEMDNIIASISTDLLMKDKPPRQERSMRRKQDDYTVLLPPELGVHDGKVDFAKGLISGVQLANVLRKLTKLTGYHNFDRLPIPYRAVATDLVTGQPVIFDRGDIVNAMRASMSVPGVIAPAEFNGMMLVDGMLTQNLPVETARKILGADVIIAVNVGTPLLKREQLTNILGVTGQMLSILTEQNVQSSIASLKPTDILISPELGDHSTGDFDNLTKISPLGEIAARKEIAKLAHLSLPPDEYAALRKRQTVHAQPDLRPVDEIRIDGLERVNPVATLSVMETQAGQPINQDVLDGDMRRIYGTGDFSHVAYKIDDSSSRRILAVEAVEKSWGPDYLRFGLGLSSDFKGDAYYNLLVSYRKTWLNSLGGEWRTDVQIGQNNMLFTEFYQPLTAEGTLFLSPNLTFSRRNQNVYQGENRVAEYDVRSNTLGLDIGSQFFRYGEARLGIEGGTLRPELGTGDPDVAPMQSEIRQGGYRARVFLDQLDSTIFPRRGWGGNLSVYNANATLGSDDVYTKWQVSGSAVRSFGPHTFNFYAKFGGALGDDPLPNYDQFQWGGFLQQSGYATGQLTAQNIRFGRLMYYNQIINSGLLEGAYAGFSLEAGKMTEPLTSGNPTGLMKSGSVFVGADSPLGPAYLGYGRAATGDDSLYFYLGRPY